MLVRTAHRTPQTRSGSLGFTIPGVPGLPALPDWLKDWRVWAAIAAVVVVLLGLLGKGGKKRRRTKLLAARLRYSEEVAKIKRT